MNDNIRYSVIAPVFNEQDLCVELCERICTTLKKTGENFEIIIVDDGSTDKSYSLLENLSHSISELKIVRLSRNFGQEPAIISGIEFSLGEELILIDGDLQDPPEVILDLIEKKNEGYGMVSGVKHKRKDGIVRRLFISVFYLVMYFFAQIEYPMNMGVFSIMDRRAGLLLLNMPEHNKHISGLRLYIGFRQARVQYERELRRGGKSKSIYQLIRMGTNAFFAFSMFPLRMTNFLLLMIGISGIVYLALSLFTNLGPINANLKNLILDNLIVIAIIIFSVSLTIIAEYVGRIFEMSKRRPIYIVDTVTEGGKINRISPPMPVGRREQDTKKL